MNSIEFLIFTFRVTKCFPNKLSLRTWLKCKMPFSHNRLWNVVSIKISSRLVAKSGQAEILELLFQTGIFNILAKTLLPMICSSGN